jgi:hypothetical protein
MLRLMIGNGKKLLFKVVLAKEDLWLKEIEEINKDI